MDRNDEIRELHVTVRHSGWLYMGGTSNPLKEFLRRRAEEDMCLLKVRKFVLEYNGDDLDSTPILDYLPLIELVGKKELVLRPINHARVLVKKYELKQLLRFAEAKRPMKLTVEKKLYLRPKARYFCQFKHITTQCRPREFTPDVFRWLTFAFRNSAIFESCEITLFYNKVSYERYHSHAIAIYLTRVKDYEEIMGIEQPRNHQSLRKWRCTDQPEFTITIEANWRFTFNKQPLPPPPPVQPQN